MWEAKNKARRQMECVSCEIKSNLKMQLVTLEKYVRFYMISGTLLVPVVFVITGLIVLLYSPEAASVPAVKTTSFLLKSSAVLFVAAIVFTIPIYFANKWYVRKLYGQHIERLKKIVDEMNED